MIRMAELAHLRKLAIYDTIPQAHKDFLRRLCDEASFMPTVIYDLGACLLHWTKEASRIWPSAKFYVVDGFAEAKPFWDEAGLESSLSVLSDTEKDVLFYVNPRMPGGNSYYRECGPANSSLIFPDSSARKIRTITLDSLRKEKGWPLPDLVKLDVQGAELDIYRGGKETLLTCKFLILELQHKRYNQGAPLAHEVIYELAKDGWELYAPLFTVSEYDGDYCFINTRLHSAATADHS